MARDHQILANPKPAASREKILDGAEAVFSTKGFDASAVREIAAAASVPLSLVSYHFATKSELFEAVIARRAAAISDERLAALEAIKAERKGSHDIADILGAYVGPFIRRCTHRNPGWRNYAQLTARLGTSRRWQLIVSKHYDATGALFIAEIQALYPDSRREDLYKGFLYVVGAMLVMCADTGRMELISDGNYPDPPPDTMIGEFLTFAAAGFHALATSGPHGT